MKDFLRRLAEVTVNRNEQGQANVLDAAYGSVFSGILGEARLSEWLKNNRIAAFQDKILSVDGRDYEMDFLVITGRVVFAVEVKNWHGKITPSKDGKYYIQTNSHGQIKHPNTIEKTKRFAVRLAERLTAEGFDGVEVRPLTVFVNNHCYLDRRILKEGALYMDDLDGDTFTDNNFGEEVFGVYEYLSSLPSWDKLVCTDGTVIKGKLVTRTMRLLDEAKLPFVVHLFDVAGIEVENAKFVSGCDKVKLTYVDGDTITLYNESAKLVLKNPAKNFNETSVPLTKVLKLQINYR